VVRGACHRALMARERILRDYPDWQAWRRQAREIKAEAISRLDELLPRLAREVQSWGGKVLWAWDAAQARELILGLARQAPGMISWLTGPSRTADIEKVLVLGAQGPREFQVVLYQPED
jgi:L-lactate utilization protein LutB